jgi:NDP-sugar pyrophosphorylase family protein
VRLTNDAQLAVYKHEGFWASMDTQRDRDELNALWASGDAPWEARACDGTERSVLIETHS